MLGLSLFVYKRNPGVNFFVIAFFVELQLDKQKGPVSILKNRTFCKVC